MLIDLQIENIAVIERAEIAFSGGLNVLTGETGAGKSIVIDALHMVTGGRAGREIVRTGAGWAAVTAVFDAPEDPEWLERCGAEPSEDGTVVLFRKLTTDGRSVCRINGRTVSVSQLRDAGGALVDIHGQNDGRRMLDETTHLRYLDGYAGAEEALKAYAASYRELTALEEQLQSLEMDEGERARTLDMLTYQIEEIERVSPVPGEFEELERKRELLKNAARLTDVVEQAVAALNGAGSGDGAVTLAQEAESALRHAEKYTDRFTQAADQIREARYQLDDAVETLSDALRELDFTPGELDRLEERYAALRRLLKKYGPEEQDVQDHLAAAREKLEELQGSDGAAERLRTKIAGKRPETEALAERLSAIRRKGADRLEKQIVRELADLNMKGIRFEVRMDRKELSAAGADEVAFYMSANAGEAPGRLSRIASGGELSRIMLAMKNVLSESDTVQTLVFDEIDTGVSGVAAQRVAEKLWRLGCGRQVLCVSHLAQIAAMADAQYSVEKTQNDGRTYTTVRRLDRAGRRAELGRLTGGDRITALTLESAEEQLRQADAYKALPNDKDKKRGD
ncbi:MAG: DNA repair protein RecN [Oscillospiraceae bacterium]|nr:DNA repair protein RecN [Oscillospiraceae bacterium]